MDRIQLLLVGLPLFLNRMLWVMDILSLSISAPPALTKLDFIWVFDIILIAVCIWQWVSVVIRNDCRGWRRKTDMDIPGTAVAMKNMLETQFPGINVALANYPPPPPKRILSKLVPVAQVGVFAIIMAGDQIFPRLGMTPPPWFYTLRANRFGTISATWLFGNFIQSYLQSSGAFEVYFDGEPVFSKLAQQRFPGEIELRDLIGKKLAVTKIVDGAGANLWS
uniref:SelT-like protein n=1 Tax=Chenopodium quinoa TaxID=63459 RepID=A0A803MK68_CHEQI